MFPNPYGQNNGFSNVILILVGIGTLIGVVLSYSVVTHFAPKIAMPEQGATPQDQQQTISPEIEKSILEQQLENQYTLQKEASDKLLQQQLDLGTQRFAFETDMSRLFNTAVIFAVIILAVGMTALMILLGVSFSNFLKARTQKSDPWQNLDLREARIRLARQNERIARASYTQPIEQPSVPAFYTDPDAPISWEELRQKLDERKKFQKDG